jgi:serine/threonine-protein kinase
MVYTRWLGRASPEAAVVASAPMAGDKPRAVDGAALQARVGKVIKEKWTLTRLLGAGGMAAVYEARHEIGRRDAIKILHADVADDEELVERFRREAHAANEFSHPALVEVRDADVTEDGLPFMVMELVEGQSVAARMRKGGIELDEALELIDQLLDLLGAAHDSGIVHRDIKPSNLLIDEDGKLRVVDFGVARIKHGRGKPLTQVGTTLGTVGYMPPEQLRSGDVDARADIYAAAATLFEMLAGRTVHEGKSEDELARQILKEPAPPLAEVAPEVPPEVAKVVDRALAYQAKRRYPDAGTMRDDLRAARRGEDPPYAGAQLTSGDDPRDKTLPSDAEPSPRQEAPEPEAPADEAREDLRDDEAPEDEAPADEAPEDEAPEDEVGDAAAKPGATEIDDQATTHKRPAPDEDAPTVKRDGGTLRMAVAEDDAPAPAGQAPAPAAPSATVAGGAEADRPGGGYLGFIVAAGVLSIAVLVWINVARSDKETLPEPLVATATASATGAHSLEPEEIPPQEPAEIEPAEPEPAPPSPATKPTAPKPKADAGTPLPLPSGLPTSFPTTLPSSFPTALPSGFPTAFPKSPPPPPPP